VDLRHERCTLRRVARVLAAPLSTVGPVLSALSLSLPKKLQPAEPVRRYQWAKPGGMFPVNTNPLTCFERVGRRITGVCRLGSSRGAWYEKAHVAIDEATRLAYVEVLSDGTHATTMGFLIPTLTSFNKLGTRCKRVLTDNGSAYRSRPWLEACSALCLTPKRTKYIPRTNGKAERFIKTLLAGWAYSMSFQTSTERNRWLPRY